MNKTLEEVLRWLKSNHENSTFISPAQMTSLFEVPSNMKRWCDKHRLGMQITGTGWKITNDKP